MRYNTPNASLYIWDECRSAVKMGWARIRRWPIGAVNESFLSRVSRRRQCSKIMSRSSGGSFAKGKGGRSFVVTPVLFCARRASLKMFESCRFVSLFIEILRTLFLNQLIIELASCLSLRRRKGAAMILIACLGSRCRRLSLGDPSVLFGTSSTVRGFRSFISWILKEPIMEKYIWYQSVTTAGLRPI